MKLTRKKLRRLILNEVLSYQRQTDLYNDCVSSKGIDPIAEVPSEKIASDCFDDIATIHDKAREAMFKYYSYAKSFGADWKKSAVLRDIRALIQTGDYTFEVAKKEAEKRETIRKAQEEIRKLQAERRKREQARYQQYKDAGYTDLEIYDIMSTMERGIR